MVDLTLPNFARSEEPFRPISRRGSVFQVRMRRLHDPNYGLGGGRDEADEEKSMDEDNWLPRGGRRFSRSFSGPNNGMEIEVPPLVRQNALVGEDLMRIVRASQYLRERSMEYLEERKMDD